MHMRVRGVSACTRVRGVCMRVCEGCMSGMPINAFGIQTLASPALRFDGCGVCSIKVRAFVRAGFRVCVRPRA